jgi:hypothetical protein
MKNYPCVIFIYFGATRTKPSSVSDVPVGQAKAQRTYTGFQACGASPKFALDDSESALSANHT